jgi:GntR family transcriptional regulator
MEQLKHAITTGEVRPGEQIPSIRKVAEDLVINPNTVAKAYRELEHQGVIEMRSGMGAFVKANGEISETTERLAKAAPLVRALLDQLEVLGLGEEEIRRLFESQFLMNKQTEKVGKE